jgi:glycosyltransferase involved in cell wall biosynthesis
MYESASSISVIIPVFNGALYLAAAVETVLSQTATPGEVIIVDDGSEDDTAEVAGRFCPPVRYYRQTHGGAAVARNRGADLARGRFLAFLDADDLWAERKLACQLDAFSRDPELDVVFGHVEQFYSPELDEAGARKIRRPAASLPGYHPGAMLIRRAAFFRVGYFETRWDVGEFVDWYAKAVERGLKSLMLPEVFLQRRLHETNLGVSKRDCRTDYARILKAALDRRRRQDRS